MKKINLVVFNENYWDNRLIYSQNLRPLLLIADKHKDINIRLISFTSILMLILKYKQIMLFKKQMKELGVDILNLPVFFVPSRLFILRWFLFPFLYLNVFLYLVVINVIDFFINTDKVYVLRSYVSGMIFSTLYIWKDDLIFDARTDFITEQTSISVWRVNSLSYRIWIKVENRILNSCRKSLFISTPFMSDVLHRNNLPFNDEKFHVIYNPVDFNLFRGSFNIERRELNFVYSGSLGNWNKLENYLNVYGQILEYFPSSIFYILTNTSRERVECILHKESYSFLSSHIHVCYNVSEKEVPEYYKKAAFGFQIMDLEDSRIGVKVVEYLAAGLIPIVSATVLGAVDLCEKYNVGVAFDKKISLTEYAKMIQLVNDVKRRERISELSKLINIEEYSNNLYDYISNSWKEV